MLKTFNLKQEIEAYNKSHKKNVPLNKTWDLDFFEPENLELINKVEKLLEGLLQPPIAIDQARAVQMRYKQGKVGLLFAERLKWEQSFIKQLASQESWQSWQMVAAEQGIARENRIKALRESFQLSFLYTHSNEALVYLETFQSTMLLQIKLAKSELKAKYKRLPIAIGQKYQSYLSHLETRFTAAREQVLATMIMRLSAASESSCRTGQLNGDILSYAADRLSEEGIVLKRPVFTGHRHAFTASTFRSFHHILERENAGFKEKQKKLVWFTESWPCPSVTLQLNHQTCIVPKPLEKYVPKWKGWPKWLFSDRHARADFIVDQQFAIAQLKIPLPQLPNILNAESQKAYLQNLIERENRSQLALTALKSQKTSFFQSGFRSMLDDWKKIHVEHLHKCALKRIVLLQAISKEAPPANIILRIKLWRDIKQIIKPLEKQVLPPHLQRSFESVYQVLQKHCSQTPLLCAEGLFEQLSKGQSLKLVDRQYLLEALSMMDLGGISLDAVVIPETIALVKSELLRLLKQDFRRDELPFSELLTNGQLLKRLGNKEYQQEIQLILEKRVVRHFNILTELPEEQAKTQAEQIESLIAYFGNSSLQQAFKELVPFRQQNWATYLKGYREIAEKLAITFTHQRLDREERQVESYFESQVQSVATDVAETRLLFNLPKRLIAQQSNELTSLPLAAYEKILAGLNDQTDRRGLREAIEVTAVTRQMIIQIRQAKTLTEKEKLLDKLHSSVHQRLPDLSLFHKRYCLAAIHQTLPMEEKRHVTRAGI